MYYNKLGIVFLFSLLFTACGNKEEKSNVSGEGKVVEQAEQIETIAFQNKGHELVYKMTQKTGSYQDLLDLKDVVYEYTYRTADQKEDVSIESYIFDGELSHAKYLKHERTLAELEGEMEQGYNGKDFWLKIDGEEITDANSVASVVFTRKTNFYWFAMMQKLLDPGINYEYLGQKQLEGENYEVVKVTFQSAADEATDIYQLYMNPKTDLIDQFLFTVVSKKVTDPILMRVSYENIDGVLIPAYRKYTKSDWDATVIKDVWVEEISNNIQFNQQVDRALFEKD
ncbi:hypothetical protein DFR65_10736 [Oceanihabitans sediminis]|uniref:Uncharacterized protein n=1 Tax=Oceanihabitans sediminis TaxID=1812012 RepID=A0A368P187_9FLAO|nr:DUF6503 family protein [Oceanihabitans sediminis]RBP28419.1 hypothetical protein DFR65_10736 [Oceanihabitans sediminis]RCU56617.1 hypothetical protein DU428_12040 [Oceanihabitans sediminis]